MQSKKELDRRACQVSAYLRGGRSVVPFRLPDARGYGGASGRAAWIGAHRTAPTTPQDRPSKRPPSTPAPDFAPLHSYTPFTASQEKEQTVHRTKNYQDRCNRDESCATSRNRAIARRGFAPDPSGALPLHPAGGARPHRSPHRWGLCPVGVSLPMSASSGLRVLPANVTAGPRPRPSTSLFGVQCSSSRQPRESVRETQQRNTPTDSRSPPRPRIAYRYPRAPA